MTIYGYGCPVRFSVVVALPQPGQCTSRIRRKNTQSSKRKKLYRARPNVTPTEPQNTDQQCEGEPEVDSIVWANLNSIKWLTQGNMHNVRNRGKDQPPRFRQSIGQREKSTIAADATSPTMTISPVNTKDARNSPHEIPYSFPCSIAAILLTVVSVMVPTAANGEMMRERAIDPNAR